MLEAITQPYTPYKLQYWIYRCTLLLPKSTNWLNEAGVVPETKWANQGRKYWGFAFAIEG